MGMENKNVSPVIGRLGLEARPEFNVVLAYDEIAGGMRAKECFDDLARLHGELFNFNCQLWNFEVIRKPELFEAAAQDAARAKMMVIATRRSEAISGQAKRWIESWVCSKEAGCDAILVLLSGKAAAAGCGPGMVTSLQKMAERRGVAFLCKEVGWPAKGSQFTAQTARPMHHEARARSASLAIADAGQPRWGLNE
jgi:hypothetical protein